MAPYENRGKRPGGGRYGSDHSEPAQPCEAPYHFVPVEPELAITDAPVFHDVQQTDDDSWSGEIRCTLTALTPLLAGNYQFEYQHLAGPIKQAFQGLARSRGAGGEPQSDKKILEPLCLPGTGDDCPGAVLIAGEALKGMVRQSLQALLSAPMERVQERTFSFRPNMTDDVNIRPGVVDKIGVASGQLVAMEVVFGGRCSDVVYIRNDAVGPLEKFFGTGLTAGAAVNGTVRDVQLDVRSVGPSRIQKLKSQRGGSHTFSNHILARYREGLDGTSTFKRAFKRGDGYRWVLVPAPTSSPVNIPKPVVTNFGTTIRWTGDPTTGHVLSHPLNRDHKLDEVLKNVAQFPQEWPQIRDLVFVEYDRDPGKKDAQIVGIGHHFRHRRCYRDTIHLSRDPDAGRRFSSQASMLRDILCPRPLETAKQSEGPYVGAPQQLSAGRGLFGYVAADRSQYDAAHPNEPLAFGLGEGDFRQLAGRIAFNMAVEANPGESLEKRFLNASNKCLVPLRPLGAPKPSAVEMYLSQDRLGSRQDEGTLCTYGDTPDDPAAGDLRGRKFYLHQPDAASSPKCYELVDRRQPDWKSGDTVHLLGNQSMIARFVSRPESAFKFAIRFRDLRGWELGALLFVLTDDRSAVEQLAASLGLPQTGKLAQWLKRVPQWKTDASHPLLALKLGHGRPLGLGSVRVQVDRVSRLRLDDNGVPSLLPCEVQAVRTETLDRLAEKLKGDRAPGRLHQWADCVMLPWLQVHRFAGRRQFDYPRPPQSSEIFRFHSEQRRLHAKGRKLAKRGQGPRQGGLKPLDQME